MDVYFYGVRGSIPVPGPDTVRYGGNTISIQVRLSDGTLLFMDAGTDFGTQKDVPGKPGLLLGKDGSGVSLGTGVIVTTPVGPIRVEVASKDFSSDWRFNLGVGWKF